MNRSFEDLVNDFKFKDYLNRFFMEKATDFKKKHILEIELTNQCSIGCFYCGATIDSKPIILDYATLCHTILNFSESRINSSIIPQFSFTGGDPVEYPYFEKLLKFLGNHDLPFSLKLNPSTLNDSIYDMISESPCETVKLTFMGVRSQMKYRKKDNLNVLSGATKRFKKLGVPIVWHFSIGEFNRLDLLDSLDFVLENKPSAVSIGRLARVGKLNEKNYPEDISPKDYKAFLKQILLFFYNNKRHGFNLVFKEKLWIPFLCEERIIESSDFLKPGIRLGCDAKERLLVLTYAGDLISCGLLPSPVLGTTRDDSFFDLIRSGHNEFSLLDNASCHQCKYLEICRGCRGVAEGTKEKKDPQCWL